MQTIAPSMLALLTACATLATPPPNDPAAVEPATTNPRSAEPTAVAPAPVAGDPEWPCETDSDCVLATRQSLGCCDPCSEVEPMTIAQREEIADSCGLHHGGETCPPEERGECPPEDSSASRALCREGVCWLER